jgi:hypothetical protein
MKYSYYENLINNAETVEEADYIMTCIECDLNITDEDFEKSITYAQEVMDELEREHKWGKKGR